MPTLTAALTAKVEERADAILDRLIALAISAPPPVALRAITEIFDRLEGKPRQATELSGPDGDEIPVPPDTSSERVRQILGEALLAASQAEREERGVRSRRCSVSRETLARRTGQAPRAGLSLW